MKLVDVVTGVEENPPPDVAERTARVVDWLEANLGARVLEIETQAPATPELDTAPGETMP